MTEQQKKAAFNAGVAVVGVAALGALSHQLTQYGKEQAIIAGLPLAGLLIPLFALALGWMFMEAIKRS